MKIRLLLISLFIYCVSFGQTSVPDTETYSLQDVVGAVSPTVNSMYDCFSNANPLNYDASYNNDTYAPANSMLRFRNYDITPITLYMTSSVSSVGSGDNFNFRLLATSSGDYSGAIDVPPLTIEDDYLFTNTVGTTHAQDGTYVVGFWFAAISPYMQYRVRMVRISNVGTLQEYSSWSSYKYADDYLFNQSTISGVTWTYGSTTDRLGVQIQWNNTNPSSTETVSIDFGGGGHNSTLIMPGF